jgi:hypothetical protein
MDREYNLINDAFGARKVTKRWFPVSVSASFPVARLSIEQKEKD